jgi:hypothetical protein
VAVPDVQLARRDGVELARVGSWPTSTGRWDATAADFEAAVEALACPAVEKPRLWIGHTDQRFTPRSGDGEPTIGWIENLSAFGESLTGDYVGIPAWLDQVLASAYPRRSIEGAYGRRCALGHTHPFVIDGVSLLGVTRPGVGVLEPLSDLDDVKSLYGLAASLAEPPDSEIRVVATIAADVAAKFNPGQVRDFDGRWTDGPSGAPPDKAATAPDKLKIAGRIKLAAGETLAGSAAVPTDEGKVSPMAAIDGPDGRTVRLGVGILAEDRRSWSAANRGSTVPLDAARVDQLADAETRMQSAAEQGRTRHRELAARVQDLGQQEAKIVGAQYRTKSQAREALTLRRQIERGESLVALFDRQLASPDTAQTDADAKLYAGLRRNRLNDKARAEAEVSAARDRLAKLDADATPLPEDRRIALAQVRRELDLAERDLENFGDSTVLATGAIPTPWGDLAYETYQVEGSARHQFEVRPPDAPSDWSIGDSDRDAVYTSAQLRRLVAELQVLMSPKVSAAAEIHAGAMVALIPTADDAERLAVDGGEPAEQLHVTLAYLGDAINLDPSDRQDIIDAVSTAVNGTPVIAADGFYVAPFNPPGVTNPDGKQRETCIVLGLTGDDLDLIHTLVGDSLAGSGAVLPSQHAPWHAHMTLLYSDDLTQAVTLADRAGPVMFDRVRIALAGQNLDIPLIPATEPEDDVDWVGAELVEAAADENSLKAYWTRGEGLKRWVSSAHPWTTLYGLLKKHVGAARAKRIASEWFHDVFGYWPGDRRHRKKVTAATEPPAAEPETATTEMEEDIVSDLSEFRSRLGLSDDADEAAMLAALDALKTKADTPPSPTPEQVAASAAAAEEAEKKVAAATAEAADLRKEVEILASTVKDVTTKLAAVEAEKTATVKASVLQKAQDEGKFAPADRPQWEEDYDKAPAAVTRVLASIAPGTVVPTRVNGEIGDPEGVGDIDAEWRQVSHLFPAETSKEG